MVSQGSSLSYEADRSIGLDTVPFASVRRHHPTSTIVCESDGELGKMHIKDTEVASRSLSTTYLRMVISASRFPERLSREAGDRAPLYPFHNAWTRSLPHSKR